MWRSALSFLVLTSLLPATEAGLFDSGNTSDGQPVFHYGERLVDGRLALTPTNGFFDKGFFLATGPSPSPESDKSWIPLQFEKLQPTKPGGTARWHLWCETPGSFDLTLTGQGKWKVTLGTFEGEIEDGSHLAVPVPVKGKVVLALQPVSNFKTTSLAKLDLKSTDEGTKLLRARWRPGAAHDRYGSSTVKNPSIWVFESQNIGEGSNYSPMTTNFGYFGATFSDNGLASGGVNFSMWAASQDAKSLPPLASMPHLLATGNPAAEFSGFGHEGSGVKLRGWEAFSHHPKSVIQALRLEVSEGFETYYGYLFDDQKDSWTLYTAGRRALKTSKLPELRATSFCEVPGPPAVERTGDLVRKVRRRGWFYGDDQKWHQADMATLTSKKEIANKGSGIDQEGWFILGTGGLDFLEPPSPRQSKIVSPLPGYLAGAKSKQLFELPVTFTSRSASPGMTSATVSCQLESLNQAEARLFYGEVDCLTFANRDLHSTEKKGISADQVSLDRVWQSETPTVSFSGESVSFDLQQLKPGATYFYRILVSHKDGKSWDFESGSFTCIK
ncbi:MAG: hypothetical protein QNL33_04450 [Akkermansiaceae bacterium]